MECPDYECKFLLMVFQLLDKMRMFVWIGIDAQSPHVLYSVCPSEASDPLHSERHAPRVGTI